MRSVLLHRNPVDALSMYCLWEYGWRRNLASCINKSMVIVVILHALHILNIDKTCMLLRPGPSDFPRGVATRE